MAGLTLAGCLALLHTSPVRAFACQALVNAARDRAGVALTIGRLDYNLLTLRFTASGVVLAAPDRPGVPFLRVERADIALRASALLGRVRFASIRLTRPAVAIETDASGRSNLPSVGSGSSRVSSPRIEIGELVVDRFALKSAGEPLSCDIRDLSLDLGPASSGRLEGRLVAAQAAHLGFQKARFDVRISGAFAFDGTVVTLRPFELSTSGTALRLDGRVALESSPSQLDVTARSTIALDTVATIWPSLAPARGVLEVGGRLTGSVAKPVLAFQASSRTPEIAVRSIPLGRLAAAGRVDATGLFVDSANVNIADGQVAATATVPAADGVASAHVEARRLGIVALATALGARWPITPTASIDGAIDVRWDARGIHGLQLSGKARATPTHEGHGTVPLAGTSSFSLVAGRWTLDAHHVVDQATEITGRLDGLVDSRSFGSSTLGGRMHVVAPSSDIRHWLALLPAVTSRLPGLSSDAEAELSLAGTLQRPRASGTVALRALHLAGQGDGEAFARVGIDLNQVALDDVTVSLGASELRGSALLPLARNGAVSGTFSATVASLAPWIPSVDPRWLPSGSVEVQGRVAGTIAAPALEASLSSEELEWRGFRPGAIDGDARLDGERLSATLRAPALNVTLRGSTTIGTPEGYESTLELADSDAARLEAIAVALGAPRWQVAGRVRLHGQVSGQFGSLPQVLEATVDALDTTVEGHRAHLAAPTRVAWSPEGISVSSARLEVGGLVLTANGQMSGQRSDAALHVTVDGKVDEWARSLLHVVGGDISDVHGEVSASLDASGGLERPTLGGRVVLREGALHLAGGQVVEGLEVKATVNDGVIDLSDAHATWAGAQARATGRIPLAVFGEWLPGAIVPPSTRGQRMAVRGEVSAVSSRTLLPLLGQVAANELTGQLSATFEVETDRLSLAAVKAAAVISHEQSAVAGLPLAPLQPVRVRLEGGRVAIDDARWQLADRTVAVTGYVDIAPEPRLDLSLVGTIDLSVLRLFVPVAAGGRADADVRVSGGFDAPSLSGRVNIEDAWLRIADPKISIATLGGTLTLANDHVEVAASGLANGGTIQLDGVVSLRGAAGEARHLHLVGKELALNWPEGLRSTIDADLTYENDAKQRKLSGKVVATPGTYRRASMPSFGASTDGGGTGSAPSSSPFDSTALDLSVVTRSGAVVDNSYARIEVDADLHVGGTIGEPSVNGSLRAREGGEVYLRGNVFRIERGILEFDPKRGSTPSLQMAAQTRRAGYDIRLLATGPLDAPGFNLTSDPPLSQTDLVSLVTTGSTSNSMSPASQTGTSNAAVAAISSDVLGLAGRSLGLDTVRVGQLDLDLLGEDVDPQNRLTIGKSIRHNIDLLLSQNLSEQGLTWVVSVRPLGGGIEIRFVSRDSESRSIELRHELVFGQPAAAVKPRASKKAPVAPKIAGVTASADGLSEAEILADTKLRPGEAFDFYAWQRDREAIQQMLRDRDYLEAQVVARRETLEGGQAIRLSYQVRTGPKTRLLVSGFALAADVLEELRGIWAEAVDDRFRLGDLQEHARRAMVDSGYLWAEAAAKLLAPAPVGATKTIQLTVVPGDRVTNRSLVFEGQAAFTADRLQQEIVRRGLSDAVWRDPTPAIAALKELYRAGGYLQASITAAAVVRDSATGRMPFHIVEGPRFDVGTITIRGIDAAAQLMIAPWLGFETGHPYNPANVALAQRRIEAGLKAEGYADARAAVRSAVDESRHAAAITADITTGPRGVISEVTTTGNDVTKDAVVRRAIKLPAGTVARPSALDAAQRRLYETDAFRGVAIDLEKLPRGEGGAEQPLRANVALQEAPLYRLRYGVQLTDELVPATQTWETEPGIAAELRRRNLFGSGLGVTGGVRVDARRQSLRGAINIPSSVLWPATSTLFLKLSREPAAEQNKVDVIETSLTYQDRWRLGRRIEWSYGYSLTASSLALGNSIQPSALTVEDPTQYGRRANLFTALVWDTRDSAFNAARGFFNSSTLEYGAPELGSDFSYVRLVLQHSRYKSLGPMVLAGGATFGAIVHVTGNDVLTYQIRFRAGGDRSVRGYATQSLYPEGQPQELAGGNALVVMNGEVRFPIWRWFKGAAFLDAGNAFTDPAHIVLSDLKIGTGFGIRLDTPYALFRFDLGFPVSQPPGARSGRFYFSIGQAF